MADCVFICLDCSEVHMNENSQCPLCHSPNLQKYSTNGSTTPVSPKSIIKIIVVACSAKKDFPQNEMPALEAYASSYPQEVKEIFQQYGRPEGLGIFVLSAKYGQMMTPQQANKLKGQVTLSFTGILKNNPQIDEIFLLMSKKYDQAIDIKALSKLVRITRINAKYHGLTQRIVHLFQKRFPQWR